MKNGWNWTHCVRVLMLVITFSTVVVGGSLVGNVKSDRLKGVDSSTLDHSDTVDYHESPVRMSLDELAEGSVFGPSDRHALLNELDVVCPDPSHPTSGCLSALNSFFLADRPVSRVESYVPLAHRVPWRDVYTDVLPRHEKVLAALSREECRPDGGPIRLDLTESCSARAMVETGKFIDRCAAIRNYVHEWSRAYGEQRQTPQWQAWGPSIEYSHRHDDVREMLFYTVWKRSKCSEYSDQHMADFLHLVTPGVRQRKYDSCVEFMEVGKYTKEDCSFPKLDSMKLDALLESESRAGERLMKYSVWLGAFDYLGTPWSRIYRDPAAMESLFSVSPTLAYHQTLFVTLNTEHRIRTAINLRRASLREGLHISVEHLWNRACMGETDCLSALEAIDSGDWADNGVSEVLWDFQSIALSSNADEVTVDRLPFPRIRESGLQPDGSLIVVSGFPVDRGFQQKRHYPVTHITEELESRDEQQKRTKPPWILFD